MRDTSLLQLALGIVPILERIYNQIEAADLVIVDMSGRNPDVFYEVGYCHAKAKLCILLTQSADESLHSVFLKKPNGLGQ
jgi:nucleoside 2-deoxyribosyltransferase